MFRPLTNLGRCIGVLRQRFGLGIDCLVYNLTYLLPRGYGAHQLIVQHSLLQNSDIIPRNSSLDAHPLHVDRR